MTIVPIITALIPVIADLAKRLFPNDPAKQQELQSEMIKQIAEINIAQAEINKEEAKHQSRFVAGWRPFIGWICGLALSMNWLIFPLVENISFYFNAPIVVSYLNTEEIMGLVFGMLGMGGLRTYEKIRGVKGR